MFVWKLQPINEYDYVFKVIAINLILQCSYINSLFSFYFFKGGRRSNQKKIVCYYTNWSQYRPTTGKYLPEDTDANICTHVIYAFGWMKKNKLAAFDSADDGREGKVGTFKKVLKLKEKNPKLKILLAIGKFPYIDSFYIHFSKFVLDLQYDSCDIAIRYRCGWSFGTKRFKVMAKSTYTRRLFVFSAIQFLRSRGFDGLDLDWEFPRGKQDKKNFVLLVKDLRIAFEEEAQEMKKPRLILTAAVSASPEIIKIGYDVPKISEYLDFINLMSYDFHGKWESQTGHNSPLYAPKKDTEWRQMLSVDYASKMWVKSGAPKEKLIIGMATYGRSFTLNNPGQNGVNEKSTGGGTAGEFTKEAGFLSYYEICELLKNGATYVWDEEMKVPYTFYGDQWIGFDDVRSTRNKMKWLKKNGYGGAMVWTLDMDDFRGQCGGGTFPLIGVMAEELLGAKPRPGSKRNGGLVINKRIDSVITNDVASSNYNEQSVKLRKPNRDQELTNGNENDAAIVCYYTNWSLKRPSIGKFAPEDIDPFMCTHIIYAFAAIKDNKLAPSEEYDEGRNGLYARVTALKKKNPNLKVLIGVGGWAFGSKPFREMTSGLFRRTTFVFDSLEFLRKHNFDGLEIDWEYPKGQDDKESYTTLISELSEAFAGEAKSSKKQKLLLSVALPANFLALKAGYDIEELNKYLDIMNLMSYDYHGQWESVVGHNSPLLPLHSASGIEKKLTVDFSASELVKLGASKEKILVGMPTYGRTFTLKNRNSTDIGAEAVGGGRKGRFTNETGFLSFPEICTMLKTKGTVLVWDDEQMVPYAYNKDQWVGFDDQRSLKKKMQWLKRNGYGGVMVWSIDMDDFQGSCTGDTFPLMNSIKSELQGYKVANSINSLTVSRANNKAVDIVECEEEDGHISYHPDRQDCTHYYLCQGTLRHHMPCPEKLVFNIHQSVCDWKTNVDCSYSDYR
ncbi:putative chitinase 10 [Nymphon striatum]|nr:putative chitinase 10 [Nymphon striatum]